MSEARDFDAVCELCANCARDAVLNGTKTHDDAQDHELCEIPARAFRVDPDDEIEEWSFNQCEGYRCTMFVPIDREIMPRRCPRTIDMFGANGVKA